MTHAQIQPPKLDAGQRDAFKRLLAAMDSPEERQHGISVNTLATMLKISRPEAVSIAQELHRTEGAKLEGDRLFPHPSSVAAKFGATRNFGTDFGAAAAEIAKSPMTGGMLNALSRTERMGCVGILDVVLAYPKEGVPKSTFARTMPAERVAALLSDLQNASAIRMVDDRVYPGQNLPSVINEAAGIKG